MATQVAPLAQVKLPSGPTPFTAEQRYWRSFRNQLLIPSPTNFPVTHISYTSDSFAITTGTRVQIYSSKTRKLLKTITRFGDVARSGELRRDGRVLVAGDDTGRIQVFDVNSRAILKTWLDHKQPVYTAKFSPVAATSLLSTSDDRTVRLWDLTSGEPTATFAGHADYVRSGNFMPGTMANMVISGSYDATVKLWDPRVGNSSNGTNSTNNSGGIHGYSGGAAVMTFKHAAPVEDVLSLPSGTTVVAASGSTVSVLDLVAARPLHVITNHQKTVTALSLASGGRRLVTGSLEGHVKIFETTGWNVVDSIKYQSPILSLAVIPSGSMSSSSAGSDIGPHGRSVVSQSLGHNGHANDDRHLAVGMSTGVLSIRTRLSGAESQREREREKEMEALLAGTIGSHDSKKQKRKRRIAASQRLDMLGEGADVVIADEAGLSGRGGSSSSHRKKERPWQADLRHARYGKALDYVVDRTRADYSHLNALTLLLALRHRSAMRDALEGRDEEGVQPVLRWVCGHICDPRYVSVCVEVGVHLLDLYGEYVGGSKELHEGFRTLHRRVKLEVERAQLACQSGGMLESLMMGAT